MHVVLAVPRGFCAGAIRAIKIVEQALESHGRPVYVLHEIVHNRHVIEDLRNRGTIFIERLAEVPAGAVIIFSAHGVPSAVVKDAKKKGLRIIDATCPLITKIHSQVRKFSRLGYNIIIIGHSGHPEIEGIRGRAEGPVYILSSSAEVADLKVVNPDRLAYVTQTTLSFDDTLQIIKALKNRFPVRGPDLTNICYATQARQRSVQIMSGSIDLLLVIGAHNSSNSNRLREIGEQCGVPAYLIEDAGDLNPQWFSADARVGVTAGASAPEEMVQKVVEKLQTYYPCTVSEMAGVEHQTFIPAQSNQADLGDISRV
ncbi:MAG: 4-hydroxy-3-methylbut-2-enyl diphosphate reductase [Syntrophales bacterium]